MGVTWAGGSFPCRDDSLVLGSATLPSMLRVCAGTWGRCWSGRGALHLCWPCLQPFLSRPQLEALTQKSLKMKAVAGASWSLSRAEKPCQSALCLEWLII